MKKRFTPDDLKYFEYLSHPVISPDGKRIACVLKRAEEEGGTFPPSVLLFDKQADGSYVETEYRLPLHSEQPFFLKNSHFMTLVSDISGEKQVYLINLLSEEQKKLTSLRHGVSHYRISPDETRLVFDAVLWPEEVEKGLSFTEMSSDEKVLWLDELDHTPYVCEDLTYKMDEWYGMRRGEYPRVGIASMDGKTATLVDGLFCEAELPSWSQDSQFVSFYGYPHHGAKGRQKELFLADREGKGLRQLTESFGAFDSHPPIFTKDGREVISFTFPSYTDYSSVLTPFAVTVETGERRPLIGEWDESICFGAELFIVGRTENGENASNAYLSSDGKYLYFLSGSRGRTGIYRVDVTEGEPGSIEAVLPGDTDIRGFFLGEDNRLVYLQGDFYHPAELCFGTQKLTNRNEWLQGYAFGEVESCEVPTKDGREILQYYLVHPVNQAEGQKYPAVLDIKGGPETMYGAAYWHEFHALSSVGMAVICPNPRGSVGFSRSYMADIICWKQEIVEDMETIVEDAVKRGFIDPERVGVTGGSYGGYMTNKLMGRSDKFAAAVTQRSLVNPGTSYGTGDMGFISSGGVPENFRMLPYLEDRVKGNIITYIDHFKIPLLILHAKKDFRCTFEQAEQLFMAMKDRNPEVPVRLVMFPEENHNLTRGGKLYNQIRHLQEMTDWFCRYLKAGEEAEV